MTANTGPSQQALQGRPRLVLTDQAQEVDLSAQREDVEGDIGRPTGPLLDPVHVHDRYRGLGGDAGGGTGPVAVEHDVTDDQHPGLVERGNGGPHGCAWCNGLGLGRR